MIFKLKTELLKTIKSGKLNVFLVFLISSFVILIFTKLSKNYTNTITFAIEKTGIPEDKLILEDSSHQLQITLKTHGFKWLKYYMSPPKIAIDFSKEVYVAKGAYIYTKTEAYLNEKKQFQNQVEILRKTPDTLTFRYDTNLVKRVPVTANATITYTPGYNSYEGVHIVPDSVTVIGPHEIVSKIATLPTVPVVLKGVKSPVDQPVKLILPEHKNILKFSDTDVRLHATVEKFTEGRLDIPVKVTHIPKGVSITYFPKTIKVSYYTSLNHFKTIKAKDFEIECDFRKVSKAQSFLQPEFVSIPKHVKHVKLHQKHVEFIILK
jgi:hypothetical protein